MIPGTETAPTREWHRRRTGRELSFTYFPGASSLFELEHRTQEYVIAATAPSFRELLQLTWEPVVSSVMVFGGVSEERLNILEVAVSGHLIEGFALEGADITALRCQSAPLPWPGGLCTFVSSSSLAQGSTEPLQGFTASEPAQDTAEHEVLKQIQVLLGAADAEVFEDGKASRFSDGLADFIRRNGVFGLARLAEILFKEHVNPETVAEALRCLGDIEDPETKSARFQILANNLEHASPQVRDAAALGLSFMEDPRAIPFLRRAIEREHDEGLRKDLQGALEMLVE